MPAKSTTLKDFLESVPAAEERLVELPSKIDINHQVVVTAPSLQLFCDSTDCQGVRILDCVNETFIASRIDQGRSIADYEFLNYRCRNCRAIKKRFALRLWGGAGETTNVTISKFGELPRFGEPRPNIIKDELDDDLGLLDRGYRAETAGLGIGAYAYYRRFVEDHRDKIFSEIRKVAVAQAQPQDLIDTIDRAMRQRKFTAAVEEMKDAIPDSLRINGENPLILLHDALSVELHGAEDDVELLENAQDIRTVLNGLIERTKQALKNIKELNDAVSRMSRRKSAKAQMRGARSAAPEKPE